MLTRENTDFSTHLMKYIWWSPKNVNIPYILHGLQKNVFMFMDIDVHVDIFLFMTYLKAPLL